MISILIINWNGQRFMDELIQSILRQTYQDFEIILVDNASSDGSVEHVARNYSGVEILSLDRNFLFSTAANRGFARSRGKYIALLNNDVVISPNWLFEMKKSMDSDPTIAACACKMLFYNQPHLLNAAGDCLQIDGLGRNIGYQKKDSERYNLPAWVFGACAGAALYRRSALEKIGWFDKDFSMIFEDVDFNFRANLLGYRFRYVPSATAYHHHCASIGILSDLNVYFSSKNDLIVLLKNLPLSLFLRNLVPILKAQIIQALTCVYHRRSWAYFRGKTRYLSQIPKMMGKRAEIQQSKVLKTKDIRNLLSRPEK